MTLLKVLDLSANWLAGFNIPSWVSLQHVVDVARLCRSGCVHVYVSACDRKYDGPGGGNVCIFLTLSL